MHIGCPQRLVAVVALVASAGASALGFGSIRSSVVLGQPLNLAIPVSLAEGETLASDCASAEVTAGEARLPPGSVRVRVTQGRDASESVLRITTNSVVEEPVVNVTVSVGCPTRLTRTLVLLADPPTLVPATAETPSLPVAGGATRPAARPPGAEAATAADDGQARRDARPPAAPRPRPARVARPAAPAPLAAPRPAPIVVAAAPASAPLRSAPAAAAAPARPVVRAESRPRLQLDGGQVSAAPPAAVLAAQEQASAARASASAAEASASAATERMRAMEAELGRVRQEAKAQTEALVQLRQQLALDRAQRDQPTLLTNVLAAVAALLLLLVAWLFLRLRRQTRAEQTRADWWEREATGLGASQMEASSSTFAASSSAAAAAALRPQAPAAPQRIPTAPAPWSDSVDSRNSEVDLLISPPTVPAPTAVTIPSLPPPAPHVEESDRAMSVDEQIDLEQQADFFIALGHDDAAIDLLMAHMRSTGGASPLPFLKLLEIHRRRNQREAYERTRVRFNQRFNSVAPEWQADPKLGRKLEDYQLAMGRIQRAWPSPLDAMAELEALLFRRGGGAELFDLPAYQEVLFLYQMARDLHQAESAGSGSDVDVLLPIGGRSLPMTAPEGTIVLRPEFNDGQPLSLALDDTAVQPPVAAAKDLDLDLSTQPGDSSALTPDASPTPEGIDDGQDPPRDEDFWGANPDARPTR